MIYILAGHHFSPKGKDPGAVSPDGKYVEAELTRQLRDLVAEALKARGYKYILDKDHETLPELLARIEPGSGSVLIDLHFNSSVNLATGIECFVPENANKDEMELAKNLCAAGVRTCNLYNRGVKREGVSNRKRLAVLHCEAGIKVLLEVGFINNPNDMRQITKNMLSLAAGIAEAGIEAEKKRS